MKKVFKNEIEKYGSDCAMCNRNMLSPYRLWDDCPSSNIVFNSYCDIENKAVCCFCRGIKRVDAKVKYSNYLFHSVVYLVYSQSLDRYKIGETEDFFSRIRSLRYSKTNNGKYKASDWKLVRAITLPNGTQETRKKLEHSLHILFRKFREKGEYFYIPLEQKKVIGMFLKKGLSKQKLLHLKRRGTKMKDKIDE